MASKRILLALAVLLSSPSWARVAVLAVPGEDPAAQALASQVRSRLQEAGDDVVDEASLGRRLRGPQGIAGDIVVQRAALAAADEAFAALDHEHSVALLDDLIEELEKDGEFSLEKADLLERARLSCAQRLVGLAGPAETGKAETKNGQRARFHLAQALRVHPGLALEPARTPPKMRALLRGATDDVKAGGVGGLNVSSMPAGATVYLEGRVLGTTPLKAAGVVPVGRHRLWLELGARRSLTRVVDIDAGVSLPAEIDVGFEGSLVPAGPGLTPVVPFTTTAWRRLAGFVDVDVVVAAGVVDGQPWALTLSSTAAVRQARFASDRELVAWVRGEGKAALHGGGAPPGIFAPEPVSVPAAPPSVEAAAEFPWIPVSAGAVVVVVVVVIGALVYATRQIDSTIGVSFGAPP